MHFVDFHTSRVSANIHGHHNGVKATLATGPRSCSVTRSQIFYPEDLREMAKNFVKLADTLEGKKRRKPKLGAQHRAILDHMRVKGSISNVEAQTVHRIRALPRRIADLREHGYKIETQYRKDPTGQRYVRYYLSEAI